MSTYTFTTKTQPTEPGQLSNFGGIVNDANRIGMTGATGAGMQCVDISGTPVVSPATVSNSAPTTLTIPLNAVQVTFLATTNTVNISESSATVADHYMTIPTGTQVSVDCARQKVMYLQANTGAATLSFFFKVV
jgi:hypothetical protein